MTRKLSAVSLMVLMCAFTAGSQTRAQVAAAQTVSSQAADLAKLSSDALLWLQGLIRINTTNPPGNELVAAKYLVDILQREGISAEIFESAPGRGFLVARLSSS